MDEKEMRKIVTNNDKRTLEDRIKRKFDLGRIELDATKGIPPRLQLYLKEANSAYVNGLFNSSIFCSIQVVDQIIRHEYVKIGGYEKVGVINNRITFGKMICFLKQDGFKEKMRSVIEKKQSQFEYDQIIEKLEKLNKIRNEVVAHPIYFDFPDAGDENRKEKIALIKKSLDTLLRYIDDKYSKDEVPFDESAIDFWESVVSIYLPLIALRCYTLMADIIWVFYKVDE